MRPRLLMSRRRSFSSSAGSLRRQRRNTARAILPPSSRTRGDHRPHARRCERGDASRLFPASPTDAPGAVFSEELSNNGCAFQRGIRKARSEIITSSPPAALHADPRLRRCDENRSLSSWAKRRISAVAVISMNYNGLLRSFAEFTLSEANGLRMTAGYFFRTFWRRGLQPAVSPAGSFLWRGSGSEHQGRTHRVHFSITGPIRVSTSKVLKPEYLWTFWKCRW